ncbi:hypothetical protein POM88_002257 [Heracleum sosnowskyi]|uniref:Uncharacterized protein n=1 Tax=Heracleum sosnowskyi TaxID=360622 RepID=A0AAD8JE16_9APIA|nr:hypothetical protein POM88_002257 [Heracleum sosnowskyi]
MFNVIRDEWGYIFIFFGSILTLKVMPMLRQNCVRIMKSPRPNFLSKPLLNQTRNKVFFRSVAHVDIDLYVFIWRKLMGQALQFNWLFEKGAIILHKDETFSVDFDKVEGAVESLSRKLLTIQAMGDKNVADELLMKYCGMTQPLKLALQKLEMVQISEAKKTAQNQKEKIDEREAQLQEAEDILNEVREELGDVQAKFGRVTRNDAQHLDKHENVTSVVAFEAYRPYISQNEYKVEFFWKSLTGKKKGETYLESRIKFLGLVYCKSFVLYLFAWNEFSSNTIQSYMKLPRSDAEMDAQSGSAIVAPTNLAVLAGHGR